MNNLVTSDILSDRYDNTVRDLACVVLTWNTRPQTHEVVESLAGQSTRPEIIVVNSGGGDPVRLMESFGDRVKVIHHGGALLPGAARNLGILATSAPIIAFLPCDFVPDSDWARRIVEHHGNSDIVSGELRGMISRNLSGLASCLLVRSRTLHGTGYQPRMDHCVSYARTLFERHGVFREDVRTGEDREFQRRSEDRPVIHRCPRVYRHTGRPGRVRTFLSSQYSLGERAHRTLTTIGREALAAGLWRIALRRLPRMFKAHWRHSDGRERLLAALGIPLLLGGAVAYGVGARIAARRIRAEAMPSLQDDPGVYALLQVRNGMRFLPGYLANLSGKVAGVIALDDGSTDGTREFLTKSKLVCKLLTNPCEEPHNWDEVNNRKRLVEAALDAGAAWVIAVDVDERLPGNFSRRLKQTLVRAGREDIASFAVWMREIWDWPDKYRMDGRWGSKTVARLFNVRLGDQYDGNELHGQWAPMDSRKAGRFVQADLEIFHLGMIGRRDRLRRRRKYQRLDPERRWQAIGYEYLTDERRCVCRTINSKAMYQPLARGAEIDPSPPRILALLAFYNEARFLPGYLDNVAPRVDGIIALDDGSTDDSAVIVRRHPKVLELLSNPVTSPHEWNENANQKRLIRAAGRHNPDWLLVVDADERLEKNFRDRANGLVWAAESRGVKALSLAFRELWGSPHTFRRDGAWGQKRKASLFKYRRDHEFDHRPLHNYWAPLNSRINGQYVHADLELYHLRMLEPQDREFRRQRYLRLDPEQKWQPRGYEYLVDETGIELGSPEPGRHYL